MQEQTSNPAGEPRKAHGREQTLGEEIANSISHGAGAVASLVGAPFLILHALELGDTGYLIGSVVFAATMIVLYLSSTLYHSFRPGRLKQIFRIIDHSAVYLLIAGTYTPFALGALRGPWGWTLLGVNWGLAVFGIVAKFTIGFRFPRLSTVLYLAMGWVGIVAIQPMLTRVPVAGLLWLLAGGLFYTGGVVFYATDARVRYGHAVWHICVMAGTICHVVAVVYHSAPRLG
jgi:hemolysin III